MTTRCSAPEDLAEIAQLPASDARRAHAESCPRCAARLAAYLDFMRGTPDVPAAELGSAEARLDEVIRREVLAPARAGAVPAEGGFWFRLKELLSPPALQPAWALAALLVVGGGLWAIYTLRPAQQGVLRGSEQGALALFPARAVAGGVELRWRSSAEADAYEVRLFSTELAEIGRVPAGADTVLLLRREAWPAGVQPRSLLVWRVAALRGGDEVAVSEPGEVEVR